MFVRRTVDPSWLRAPMMVQQVGSEVYHPSHLSKLLLQLAVSMPAAKIGGIDAGRERGAELPQSGGRKMRI
jgi:hypothetical protein